MVEKILTLEEITAYKISSELSDYVWKVVSKWDWFVKRTLGSQFTSAVDSIAANIAEGYGRYHKKDKIKFYYNARGSTIESIHWCNKAYKRNLLTGEEKEHIIQPLTRLPKDINSLIRYTDQRLRV